jgi:hypothetical protein
VKRTSLVAVVAIALLATAGVAVAANSVINHDAAATPDEKISFELTKDTHNLTWDGPAVYEGNNGDLTTLNASVNETYDNPYSFIASDVEFQDAGAFPHNKPDVSALEAAEWSKDGGSSTGTFTVADTETAPNVDALLLSTSGQSSGDTAVFSASNFSVDSDAEKRYLQLVLDVDTLDSAASVDVATVDADGDEYVATIDPSASSGNDLITNATGEGVIYQQQLGKLDVAGSGDGTVDGIQSIEVRVSDADAALSISALNVESMSEWSFGETRVDSDGDDELETETIRQNAEGGALEVHSLDTLGPMLEQGTIHGLTTSWDMTAASLSAEDVNVTYSEEAPNQAYAGTATVYYRMGLPSAYELNPSQARRTANQTVSGTELISVEYAEATGDTNMTEISDSAWTDISDSFGNRGDNVTVDETIQAGQHGVTKYQLMLGESQLQAMQETSGGPGIFGDSGQGSGGILSSIISLPGAALASLLGLLGLRKRRSGS